jgi:hypothetical protein
MTNMFNIVAYLLKARTVEPEKQPLLGNAHTQQRNCHEELCFLRGPCRGVILKTTCTKVQSELRVSLCFVKIYNMHISPTSM